MTADVIESLERLEKDLAEQVGNAAVDLEKVRAEALAASAKLDTLQAEHWRLQTVLRQVQRAVTEAKGGVK